MDDIQQHAKQIAFQIRKHGYTYDQVSYLFKLARKEANLTPPRKKKNIVPSLSTEQLRHTRATLLAEKGMPLPHLQGFLGHESVTTTEHYTRTAQYNFREKLNEIEPPDPLGTDSF